MDLTLWDMPEVPGTAGSAAEPGVAGDQGRASFDDSTSLELVETDFFGLYSVITTVTPLTVTWWKMCNKINHKNGHFTEYFE